MIAKNCTFATVAYFISRELETWYKLFWKEYGFTSKLKTHSQSFQTEVALIDVEISFL